MNPPKILIVEDHENLSLSLKEFIGKEGFQIELAGDLKTAKEKLTDQTELLILDWNLPDGQGLDFLTKLRKQGNSVPVIFLTARAELVDKVLGLELGANDYITKPFEPRELLARIRVCLRQRASISGSHEQIIVGPLSIDRIRREVEFNSQKIDLVKKEFDLLVLLAESPEKVFSRDEILNKVWGYDVYPTTRTVDTHVMLLRQKINEGLIETIRSVGYRLKQL